MPSPDREAADALERRVASLESAVHALTEELARLRALNGAGSSAGVPHSEVADRVVAGGLPVARPRAVTPPPFPANAPGTTSGSWLPANVDFEALIGRYGTLVLATVSALAAMGLFLNWAIERGFLGPQQRLALGLLTAAGLAVGGMRLRRRERSFGASLLGLSLAITLVCAWGAGPALHLVPNWAAFAFAAVVSIALAVFAHAEDDEPLWSVGFSGAAIAPFVTAEGRSDLLLLFAYGVGVLACAGYAMNARRWLVAGRLFLLAALAYTAALGTAFERDLGPLFALVFPLAVAVTGVLPWTSGWSRRERMRALGALAALAAVRTGLSTEIPMENGPVAGMIAASGVLWLLIVDRTWRVREPLPERHRHLHEGDWLDAAVLPLAFALSVIAALDATATGSGWVMAGAAGILLVTVMRSEKNSLRDAAVFATVISALVALLLLLRENGSLLTGSIAALCVGCFAANRAWRSGSWTTLGLIGLGWTVAASLSQLIARPLYEYAPFGTEASAVAAVVLAAILASRQMVSSDDTLEKSLRAGAMAWAFLWVHQEIAFAFSETAAILLRVTYYAMTAVAAIWLGQSRQVPVLRHIGLGLAIVAAGTALYGARNLDAIAARIGADVVVAVFLLAIAYWYRRPGANRPDPQVVRTGP